MPTRATREVLGKYSPSLDSTLHRRCARHAPRSLLTPQSDPQNRKCEIARTSQKVCAISTTKILKIECSRRLESQFIWSQNFHAQTRFAQSGSTDSLSLGRALVPVPVRRCTRDVPHSFLTAQIDLPNEKCEISCGK